MTETSIADARRKSKAAKCDRQFLDEAGTPHPRAMPGCKGVRFIFEHSGATLDMELAKLSPEILQAAAAFGLNTSVGNTFGAIQDPNEALEAATQRWEQLVAGQWSSDRHTGPRLDDLVEAACRFRQDNGKSSDDAYREALRDKLAEPAEAKVLANDPRIGVYLAAIRKERAEAALRAKGDTVSGGADSLLD